jgi:hypothetical protein
MVHRASEMLVKCCTSEPHPSPVPYFKDALWLSSRSV